MGSGRRLLHSAADGSACFVCLPRGQACEQQALLLPPRHCRAAYNTPWGGSTIRYVGDGRPFWRHIVTQSTGCCSEEMFEELYDYYARGTSYFLMPGAAESLQRIRNAGGVLGRAAGRPAGLVGRMRCAQEACFPCSVCLAWTDESSC